ncbi:receptor-like protein EIX2 [Quercus lobata]|uniref:Leucine-rich repeat-containing N-terminal plant-type domain-containing protein n=1 Tax=Quercus lobata TaxID=97700 RepID=A0A7N2MKL0_QUELO|nr:receptor-like protein EIX2 [Quercus lobata]
MEGSLGFLFLTFLIIPLPHFFIFCIGHTHSEVRCIDTERHALLNFKQDLIDPSNRLSFWTVDGDCCHWLGVVCHNLTAHITQLNLRTFYPEGDDFESREQFEAYERSMFGGKLNPSLLDFKHLNYFDLSFNNFSASPIPEFLGSMKSLTSLNLSNARFVGLIPHQLGNLSNLLYLNLKGSGLYVNNLQWLSGLSLLQHLDMSFVNLSKATDWLQLTNTLPSLFDLRLSSSQLPFIPPTLTVNFSSLLTLDLSGNQFENTLILSWIFGLRNLVSLDLSDNYFQGPIPVDLQNMTSLRHLDLSGNYFNHTIPNWFYSFSRLEFLNLCESKLQDTISNAIGNLTSAISIDLSFNELEGKLPRSLGNLCNLREIRLSYNKWSQKISEILESLSRCLSDRLEILDLSKSQLHGHLTDELGVFKNLVKLSFQYNSISGPIPVSLANLPSLTYLDFSNNHIYGSLPQNFGQLKNLVKLVLWNNSISGPLPVSLGNLSSLTYLDLGYNQFNGTLPQNFGQFSKLENLYIDSNMLKGVVSEVHFSNLTSLRNFYASRNQLTLKATQNWIPPFQLESLYLRSWNLGPKFPPWLCSQRHLQLLDISNTRISDVVPPSFWNLSSQFQILNLSHNLIQGEIPNSPVILSASVIDLSSNHFKGPLPCISSNVLVLDLSKNSFSRSISHFLCFRMNEQKNVGYLNLDKNLLSGIIPDCLMKWNNLEVLNLGNNNFSGSIPSSMGSLTYLSSLHLYNNKFSGTLPSSLKNCKKLVIIDVAENRFAGNIPSWIGHRCTSLMILNLRSNYFHGHIPKELCALASLQILDLSHNKLSGSIPKCVKHFSAMATNNISNDHLNSHSSYYGETLPLESALLVIKGNFFEYSTILQMVKSIDFSKNRLSGKIPIEVTSLQGLQSLNLSYNLLIGSIPENIGAMGSLESIDFSLNQLSGQVPSSMSSLTFLNHLNLSNNNLTGKIPLSTQLQSLDPSSFIGNKLCGPPLTNSCTTNGVKPNIRSKATSGLVVDWFYVSMSLGLVVGFWGVCGPLLLNKQWRMMYFQFLDHIGYKLNSVVL